MWRDFRSLEPAGRQRYGDVTSRRAVLKIGCGSILDRKKKSRQGRRRYNGNGYGFSLLETLLGLLRRAGLLRTLGAGLLGPSGLVPNWRG
jgi:hypothetical protein